MLAIIFVAACFFSVIAPAVVLGIRKDGSPFRREWWT